MRALAGLMLAGPASPSTSFSPGVYTGWLASASFKKSVQNRSVVGIVSFLPTDRRGRDEQPVVPAAIRSTARLLPSDPLLLPRNCTGKGKTMPPGSDKSPSPRSPRRRSSSRRSSSRSASLLSRSKQQRQQSSSNRTAPPSPTNHNHPSSPPPKRPSRKNVGHSGTGTGRSEPAGNAPPSSSIVPAGQASSSSNVPLPPPRPTSRGSNRGLRSSNVEVDLPSEEDANQEAQSSQVQPSRTSQPAQPGPVRRKQRPRNKATYLASLTPEESRRTLQLITDTEYTFSSEAVAKHFRTGRGLSKNIDGKGDYVVVIVDKIIFVTFSDNAKYQRAGSKLGDGIVCFATKFKVLPLAVIEPEQIGSEPTIDQVQDPSPSRVPATRRRQSLTKSPSSKARSTDTSTAAAVSANRSTTNSSGIPTPSDDDGGSAPAPAPAPPAVRRKQRPRNKAMYLASLTPEESRRTLQLSTDTEVLPLAVVETERNESVSFSSTNKSGESNSGSVPSDHAPPINDKTVGQGQALSSSSIPSTHRRRVRSSSNGNSNSANGTSTTTMARTTAASTVLARRRSLRNSSGSSGSFDPHAQPIGTDALGKTPCGHDESVDEGDISDGGSFKSVNADDDISDGGSFESVDAYDTESDDGSQASYLTDDEDDMEISSSPIPSSKAKKKGRQNRRGRVKMGGGKKRGGRRRGGTKSQKASGASPPRHTTTTSTTTLSMVLDDGRPLVESNNDGRKRKERDTFATAPSIPAIVSTSGPAKKKQKSSARASTATGDGDRRSVAGDGSSRKPDRGTSSTSGPADAGPTKKKQKRSTSPSALALAASLPAGGPSASDILSRYIVDTMDPAYRSTPGASALCGRCGFRVTATELHRLGVFLGFPPHTDFAFGSDQEMRKWLGRFARAAAMKYIEVIYSTSNAVTDDLRDFIAHHKAVDASNATDEENIEAWADKFLDEGNNANPTTSAWIERRCFIGTGFLFDVNITVIDVETRTPKQVYTRATSGRTIVLTYHGGVHYDLQLTTELPPAADGHNDAADEGRMFEVDGDTSNNASTFRDEFYAAGEVEYCAESVEEADTTTPVTKIVGRRQLQALAKENGIPANIKSDAIIGELTKKGIVAKLAKKGEADDVQVEEEGARPCRGTLQSTSTSTATTTEDLQRGDEGAAGETEEAIDELVSISPDQLAKRCEAPLTDISLDYGRGKKWELDDDADVILFRSDIPAVQEAILNLSDDLLMLTPDTPPHRKCSDLLQAHRECLGDLEAKGKSVGLFYEQVAKCPNCSKNHADGTDDMCQGLGAMVLEQKKMIRKIVPDGVKVFQHDNNIRQSACPQLDGDYGGDEFCEQFNHCVLTDDDYDEYEEASSKIYSRSALKIVVVSNGGSDVYPSARWLYREHDQVIGWLGLFHGSRAQCLVVSKNGAWRSARHQMVKMSDNYQQGAAFWDAVFSLFHGYKSSAAIIYNHFAISTSKFPYIVHGIIKNKFKYDSEEMTRLSRGRRDNCISAEGALPYVEARDIVRGLRLRSAKAWYDWCRKNGKRRVALRLPSLPPDVYAEDGWTNWPDFLGNEPRPQVTKETALPFAEAREVARGLQLTGEQAWREWCQNNSERRIALRLPYSPDYTYKGDFTNWADYLGYESRYTTKAEVLPFAEARKVARGLHLTSKNMWHEWCSDNAEQRIALRLPYQPDRTYGADFTDWPDFLGYEQQNVAKGKALPFAEAREFAHGLGLKGKTEWEEWCRENREERIERRLLSNPNLYKEWINWRDWIGR